MKLISTRRVVLYRYFFASLLLVMLTGQRSFSQVCTDPINIIYGLNSSGNLYPINVNTGNVGTAMSPSYSGNSPSQANGLGLNILNGKFYYFKRNPSSSPGEFVSYDPVTGIVSTLAACPTSTTIHTGCVSYDGKGYYCNDVNGAFYYYSILTNSWVAITSTIYDNYGTNITSVISSRTSGDMCIDGSGNLWFVCSGNNTYGLYKFDAPLPTTSVSSMTATQIIDPNTAMPSSNGFQGAAFAATGDLFLATGDNKLYKLAANNTLSYIATFTTSGVGNDMTSCNFPNAVLPVLWNDFTVQLKGSNSVALNWSVSQESASSGYYVERKTDGQNWQDLGFVASTKNAGGPQSYSYTDYQPMEGVSYYRLRQTDLNGQVHYSAVQSITVSNQQAVSIWPVPARDNLHINRTGNNGSTWQVQIFDLSGRMVLRSTLTAGTNTIDIRRLLPGSYLVRVEGDNGSLYNQRLIKN